MISTSLRVLLTSLTMVTGLLSAPVTAAAAAPVSCAPPVPSTTQPGYTVADPHCDIGTSTPFAPLTDPAGRVLSTVYAAMVDGAAYRIEVPRRWNGDLVIYAHGYRGTGRTVWVDSPSVLCPRKFPGCPNCGWLNRLKNSDRTCSLTRSVNRTFFISVMSALV